MKRMLINATQAEELRVAIVDGQTLYDIGKPSHRLNAGIPILLLDGFRQFLVLELGILR